MPAAEEKTPPLVILGFDAGDPEWLARWAREGHLPTLAGVMERGCWGRTGGPELISEHGVWMSLFSGISRGDHGCYYFRQMKPGTYDLQPVTGLDLDAPGFWHGLRGGEKKVAIMDVPDAYPVAGLTGVQIANWAPHHGWISRDPAFAAAAEPPELLGEARRIFGPQMDLIEKHDSTFVEDRRLYRLLRERVEKKGRLCRDLLARDRYDLAVVVFSESHTGNHQFWKYRPGSGAPESEFTHAIRDIYQDIDREMGALLAQLPEDANVFIVSSVGMEGCYPADGLMEAFLRELGYQAPPAPAPPSLRPMALARRFVPEAWRVALSRFLPRDTRERLLADQFRGGSDWKKTTAFSIPGAYTSFVRVNLRGREPEGIVEPGTEYDALLGRLEADLLQLIDPKTGGRAVKQVARTEELFGAGVPDALPDLFVEWEPTDYFVERVLHPRAELVQRKPDFFRNSDHSGFGFVAAAGPSIGNVGPLTDTVSVLDLAPTFLSLLGRPAPGRLTGSVIEVMAGRRVPVGR